jgi:hypothetical protein
LCEFFKKKLPIGLALMNHITKAPVKKVIK